MTGQALAIDIGNPDDIHPTNKQEVGRRLALLIPGARFATLDTHNHMLLPICYDDPVSEYRKLLENL